MLRRPVLLSGSRAPAQLSGLAEWSGIACIAGSKALPNNRPAAGSSAEAVCAAATQLPISAVASRLTASAASTAAGLLSWLQTYGHIGNLLAPSSTACQVR